MNRYLKPSAVLLAVGLLGGLGFVTADDQPPADGQLIVIDANGREQKIKTWKFVVGTRPLSWLAEPNDDPKVKGPAGPQALEIRDDASLNPPLITGFVTLVPLDRIRSIEYGDMDVMTIKVATDKPDADEVVTGSTKFQNINKLTLEAEVDKGELGVAEVKFLGGVPKGIKGLKFPTPKAPAAATGGRPATVTTTDAKKTTHQVTDLKPLYKFADGERLSNTLLFKKTLRIDVGKVYKIRVPMGGGMGTGPEGPDWGVTLRDSTDEETFTLLKQGMIDDKNGTLVGLVGKTAFGYKLFPPGTIAEVQFEEAK